MEIIGGGCEAVEVCCVPTQGSGRWMKEGTPIVKTANRIRGTYSSLGAGVREGCGGRVEKGSREGELTMRNARRVGTISTALFLRRC